MKVGSAAAGATPSSAAAEVVIRKFFRAPRFFLIFRRSGPIWRPEACGKRLAGVFGSVVGTHSARLWRASASSA